MSEILRYFPNVCDFPDEYAEFNSLQELLNIEWVKQFAEDEYGIKKAFFTNYFVNTVRYGEYIIVELKANYFCPIFKERLCVKIGTFKKDNLPEDVYKYFRKWLTKDHSEDLLPSKKILDWKLKHSIKHLNFKPQPFTTGIFSMMLNQSFEQFKIGE